LGWESGIVFDDNFYGKKGDEMKNLPKLSVDYRTLNETVKSPIRHKLLMAGIELAVFDRLDSFRSAGEIAETMGLHPGNTVRFLNALTMIGLIEKKEGMFRNLPEAAPFLTTDSPTYFGPLLRLIQSMCLDSLNNLVERIKSGPRPATEGDDFASEELWADATRASAAWVTGGAGDQMAAIVSGLPEFSGFRRMLDLGGGHGMFTLYFVVAHPTMTGVVFDRPAVAAVAETFIRQYEMQDRVSTMTGDYLKDDIGEGYDFIWACSTLNFARHDLDSLIRKILRALNPGGVFIAFQDGLTDEQTRPDIMLGHLGEALRIGKDLFFEQGEIADCMLRCGFRSVRSRTLLTPMGLMDMDIARKIH
jgi:SAM-dependent methyltransferase